MTLRFAPIAAAKAGFAAGPVVGAAIAAVSLALQLFLSRKRPQQKVATTQVANEVERFMQQNLAAFEASPKTSADRQQALQNFDQAWAGLVSGCGQPQMGDPGRRCIEERQRGGRWDWFAGYRDPIERTMPTDSVLSLIPGAGTSGELPLGLLAGLALLIVGVIL